MPSNGDTSDATDDIRTPLTDIETDLNTARPIVAGGTGATSASAARTALGVAIGTDVQAYDAGLASIAGLTTAANKMIYTTASDVYAVADLTAAGRAILDDADATAQRATLGLVIGTNVQAYDAELAQIAGLADPNADRILFWDDSAGSYAFLTAGSGLTISGTTITADQTTVGLNTTTGAATVGPWSLPAGVKRFWITSNKSSLSGTGNIVVQLRVSASFVTSGYDSRSLAGTSLNVSSTSGMVVSLGAAANFWDGRMEFWLHDPATNLWLCTHTGTATGSVDLINGSGSIALAGVVDGVQINSTAGTFDVSSFNVHY